MLRMLGLLAGVLLGQFYVAELAHKEHGVRAPVAVLPEASANSVTWAHVSGEIDQRLTANSGQRIHLRPDEWKSGDIFWIIDVAGDPQAIEIALRQLSVTAFKDRPAKIAMADAQGHPRIGFVHDIVSNTPDVHVEAGAG